MLYKPLDVIASKSNEIYVSVTQGQNNSLNINTTQYKETKYNINLCYFAYLEQMLVFVTFD